MLFILAFTEKVFVYVITKNRDTLLSTFQQDIEKARREDSPEYSIGIVTKVLSSTQTNIILVPENAYILIAENFDEFQLQVYGKIFSEVHRIFVDYIIDLLQEILERKPKYAEIKKKCKDLSYKKNRDKALSKIGLDMLPEVEVGGATRQQLGARLNELENTRHLIEHNNGIADKLFLKRYPSTAFQLGDRIKIDLNQIGLAMALVETLAEDINNRALEKFLGSPQD